MVYMLIASANMRLQSIPRLSFYTTYKRSFKLRRPILQMYVQQPLETVSSLRNQIHHKAEDNIKKSTEKAVTRL